MSAVSQKPKIVPTNSRCWADKSPYRTTEASLLAATRVASGTRPDRATPRAESKKVCIYLGEIGDDVEAVATKRGLTVSQLLTRAWRIAREEMAALPSSPVPGLRQMREKGSGAEPSPGAWGQARRSGGAR